MKYAVGVMNFFDNELVVEIVEALSVKEALCKHSFIFKNSDEKTLDNWINGMPDSLDKIKEDFMNADWLVDVVEIND